MASGFLTFLTKGGAAARRGFVLFIFAIFGALTLSVALADRAAAQQSPATSITYAAYPSDLVSVTAEGKLVVLQQPSAGIMTATIVGTSFILSGGEYIRNPAFAPGERFMTLRFLSSCSVRDGCPAFGLDGLANAAARIAAFRAMDITTMRQFAASGADLNEQARFSGNNNPSGRLLYILADVPIPDGEAHPNLAKMSVLIDAGVNINSQNTNGDAMLHWAAFANGVRILTGLLAMPGISVNITDSAGNTPLDEIVLNARFFITEEARESARLLREAGGECETQSNAELCDGE